MDRNPAYVKIYINYSIKNKYQIILIRYLMLSDVFIILPFNNKFSIYHTTHFQPSIHLHRNPSITYPYQMSLNPKNLSYDKLPVLHQKYLKFSLHPQYNQIVIYCNRYFHILIKLSIYFFTQFHNFFYLMVFAN
jgi:hypothetical protein